MKQKVWRQVEDFTVTSGVKRWVYLSLYLAEELMGAKVPDEFLKRLKPSVMNNSNRSQGTGDSYQGAGCPLSNTFKGSLLA